MTVYTGLLDEAVEEIDGIPLVPARYVLDNPDEVRPMVELIEQFIDPPYTCSCDALGGYFSRRGVVCSGEQFRWRPGQPVARFDQFTPPYVSEVRCG